MQQDENKKPQAAEMDQNEGEMNNGKIGGSHEHIVSSGSKPSVEKSDTATPGEEKDIQEKK